MIVGRFTMPYNKNVSVNQMYGRKPRVYLHPESRQWKTTLIVMVKNWLIVNGITPPKAQARVWINLRAYFPRQRGRRPDAHNFLKLAADAIAEALGTDDSSFVVGVEDVNHKCKKGQLIYEVSFEENVENNPTP